MDAFERLSSAKSDQAKIEGFRAVPTYEAGAEPQPRMRSFICWEADIVLVDTAGESDPFVHDCSEPKRESFFIASNKYRVFN